MKPEATTLAMRKSVKVTLKQAVGSGQGPWLLLIHQIPPKPDYLRIKVGRRLQRLGAIAIKNSVYALPRNDETYEDFQWVAREIVAGKGEAFIIEAKFIDGLSDKEVEALFQAAREEDYASITREAQRLRTEATESLGANVGRLRKRLSDVVSIDFFAANGREAAEALVRELEEKMEPRNDVKPKADVASPVSGATWVTRKGIKVDRIASAWLIRSFIDKKAKFKFVPGQGYKPARGELRFDMFDAEYTHEGDRCTFEVLLRRFGLDAPALQGVAEVVHDIDLKDGKYGRPEAPGIALLIAGLSASSTDDEVRLTQGAAMFASLYQAYLTTELGIAPAATPSGRGAH